MFLIRIGAANVARRGLCVHQSLCDFLESHAIDIVSLPEANIPQFSSVGFCNSWRAWGKHAALSAPDDGTCRVALVSRFPLRPVTLRTSEACGRHVAALLDVGLPHGQTETVLVVGVYLTCGNEATAAGQLEDVLQVCLQSRFRFIIIGDFNLTQEHETLLEYAISGCIRCADSCRPGGCLPATGPVFRGFRRRRIHFALQHPDLHAEQVHHAEGLSDHLIVSYDYRFEVAQPRRAPRRRPVRTDQSASDMEDKLTAWNSAPFEAALAVADVDLAWRLLSACAEDTLCDALPGATPRHEPWSPELPRQAPRAKQPACSAGLCALLKLQSRIRAFLQRPFEACLLAKIYSSLRGTRAVVPELPFVSAVDAVLLSQVEGLVAKYERQEHEAGRTFWRHRVQVNESAARSYVKRRADQVMMRESELAMQKLPPSGRHPALEVDRQAEAWCEKWRSRSHAGPSGIGPFLAAAPRPARCGCDLRFSGADLRRAAAQMKGKSAGPVSWTAEALIRLPLAWWQHAATLWEAVLHHHRAPTAWCCGRTCLLWKDNDKSRPITVLPIMWRAGARIINQRLSCWVASWKQSFDCGGLPGTSVSDALQLLQHELSNGCRGGVQQDVSGFFDSLEHDLTAAVLRHLRAPEPVVALFEHACSVSSRIFCLEGAYSTRWTHPDRGLLQGCPLSPVISAAVTHVWACYVFGANLSLSSPVTGYGYIDDRLLLLRSNQDAAALTCAVDRSSRFDQAFCLEVSVAKCSVVAAPNDRECAALASTLGYKFEQHFDALGVQAQWGRPWRLLRYSLRKATCRLCALRSLRLPSQRTRALVRSLVLPAVTWAASFATPTEDDLWLLQREVEHCMHALAGHGAAKVLFFELLGWHLEPCFAIDERILRDMWRAIVSPGSWTEELPLAQLSGWVSSCLPNLGSTLSRLGWTLSQDGRSVGSHDIDGGSRSIAIGCESFVGLQQWLIAHYRCKYIARLDRLWKPQLRTEGHAVGLQLPVPSRRAEYGFLRMAFAASAESRHVAMACVGAGASSWHFNAGGDFAEDHARHSCLCDARFPSRPHLAWNCPSLPVPASLQLPTDRAAERLCALPYGCQPPPPPCIDPEGFS